MDTPVFLCTEQPCEALRRQQVWSGGKKRDLSGPCTDFSITSLQSHSSVSGNRGLSEGWFGRKLGKINSLLHHLLLKVLRLALGEKAQQHTELAQPYVAVLGSEHRHVVDCNDRG